MISSEFEAVKESSNQRYRKETHSDGIVAL